MMRSVEGIGEVPFPVQKVEERELRAPRVFSPSGNISFAEKSRTELVAGFPYSAVDLAPVNSVEYLHSSDPKNDNYPAKSALSYT